MGRRSPPDGGGGVGAARRERLRQAQKPQGALGPPAEVSGRGGDVLHTRQAQQADGDVAQRRHCVRPAAPAHLGTILVVGHVSHVVQAILDLPMAAVVDEHLLRRSLLWRQAGYAVDGFRDGLAALDDVSVQVGGGAPNAEDLSDVGEVEVVVQLGAGPDLPRLDPPMALIDGFVRRGEKPPSGEAGCGLAAVVSIGPLPAAAPQRGPRCPCAASAGCPWP